MGIRTSLAAAAVGLTLAAAGLTAVPAHASSLTFFLSPSGNIACAMDSGGVRCDIKAHSFHMPRPPRCDLDYGDSVFVARRGRAIEQCHGDTVFGSYRHLAYGRSLSVGAFTCRSATAGVTCRNRSSGHGFFLSKTSYRLS